MQGRQAGRGSWKAQHVVEQGDLLSHTSGRVDQLHIDDTRPVWERQAKAKLMNSAISSCTDGPPSTNLAVHITAYQEQCAPLIASPDY